MGARFGTLPKHKWNDLKCFISDVYDESFALDGLIGWATLKFWTGLRSTPLRHTFLLCDSVGMDMLLGCQTNGYLNTFSTGFRCMASDLVEGHESLGWTVLKRMLHLLRVLRTSLIRLWFRWPQIESCGERWSDTNECSLVQATLTIEETLPSKYNIANLHLLIAI